MADMVHRVIAFFIACKRGEKLVAELVVCPVDERADKAVAAFEVVQNRRVGDADIARNILKPQALRPLPGEPRLGGIENEPPRFLRRAPDALCGRFSGLFVRGGAVFVNARHEISFDQSYIDRNVSIAYASHQVIWGNGETSLYNNGTYPMTTVSPMKSDTSNSEDRAPVKRKRIQPLKALRAMRALTADKEDTSQVFVIIDALSGNANDRQFERFAASPTGQRILSEKRNLVKTLSDTAWLSSLPEGSLGRAYYDFMAEENLTADGLVEASEVVRRKDDDRTPEEYLFGCRNRDQHDLWHVTTGYGRDGLGELALLAFTYAQTRNRGIGFIVLMGARSTKRSLPQVNVWRVVREAYRNGKKAQWLPGADWEALLPRPLSEVRALLGIEEPVAYREVEPLSLEAEAAFKAERARQMQSMQAA